MNRTIAMYEACETYTVLGIKFLVDGWWTMQVSVNVGSLAYGHMTCVVSYVGRHSTGNILCVA